MNIIILFTILLLAVGCDAPTTSRKVNPATGANGFSQDPGTTGATSGGNPTTSGSTSGGNPSGLGVGFENCTINPQYSYDGLNYVGACLSTVTNTLIKFKLSNTDFTNKTCLIPMHEYMQNGQPSQRYIGNPVCDFHEANVIYQHTFTKYANEQNSTIDGIMVMKLQITTPFYNCMDAASNYVSSYCPYYNGPDYVCMSAPQNLYCYSGPNNYCLANAQSSMAALCNAFQSNYSSVYVPFD